MKINCTHGAVDERGILTRRTWAEDVPDDYFQKLAAAMRASPTPDYMIVGADFATEMDI